MRTLGLFEAKNRLSELVERARQGEKIGITRRGRLAALLVAPQPDVNLREVFDNIERVRKRTRMPHGVTVDELIEEGRT